MLPSSGRSREITGPYRVLVHNHDLDCHLPYFGRAYRADVSGTESPMSFEGKIKDLNEEPWKKGGWIISFSTSNKSDHLEFIFFISETGSVNLTVSSTYRRTISYFGDLTEPESRK